MFRSIRQISQRRLYNERKALRIQSSIEENNPNPKEQVLENEKTHFGYQEVPREEKANLGDITLRYCNKFKEIYPDQDPQVTVLDINECMLQEGQKRISQTQFNKNVEFRVGDAHILDSIENNSIDIYTIAFGIRNCTDVQKVLETAFRVLKPGGSFHCLEFSRPNNETFNTIYDFYSFNAIPRLGQLVADDYESYQYLVESIRRFPIQPVFSDMIKKAGFYIIGDGYENLSMGIAAIHTGYKI